MLTIVKEDYHEDVAAIEDQTAIREMVSRAVIDKDAFEVIIQWGRSNKETCSNSQIEF